jgi:deazaflavin-dependent oxidoreductase (nitroreductase family)
MTPLANKKGRNNYCRQMPTRRIDKRGISRGLGKFVVNPVVKIVAGYVPWWSLLETTGRKSGKPWRNPVGNGLKGDTFWIVAEHGHQAGYVKNIKANPRVRLRVGGRWRTGTAHVLEHDDARMRQKSLRRVNAAFVRLMGTELLTVRVDLDP